MSYFLPRAFRIRSAGLSVAAAWIFAAGAAAGTFAACSLGEGETPECDPNAAPDAPNACHQTSVCDDGNGYPKPTDACCLAFANQEYGRCSGDTIPNAEDPGVRPEDTDFRNRCATPNPSGCCVFAQDEFNRCKLGPPVTTTTSSSGGGATSSTTTTTGAGGSAGAGGN
jgi:hypothetical protein